ncbi:hypothetical protein R1sor_009510 [Riccia sorocarpa]|uniref:Uncharacterized protein n=1 Tax=Riccia sorocarpa TaxID=122646 RepID=A0ABD3I1G3_9MARC
MVTWALSPGRTHPLKLLIRAASEYQADTKWGTSLEAAVFYTKKCNLEVGSPTMSFLLSAWAKAATLLLSPDITGREAWDNTPIWGPQMTEVRTNTLKGKTQGHIALKTAGITHLQHIADSNGVIRSLQDIDASLPGNWKRTAVIPTTRDKNRNSRLLLAHPNSLEERMATVQWKNGQQFYHASNKFIREELAPDKQAAIVRMSKWITPYKEKDLRR